MNREIRPVSHDAPIKTKFSGDFAIPFFSSQKPVKYFLRGE